MLEDDTAPPAYSHIAFWFDPYDAISVSKTGTSHQSGNIRNNRKLFTLNEHVIGDKTGYPTLLGYSEQVSADIFHQSEKLVIVVEHVRIVEGSVVVWWTRYGHLNRLVWDLNHLTAVPEYDSVDRTHSTSSTESHPVS